MADDSSDPETVADEPVDRVTRVGAPDPPQVGEPQPGVEERSAEPSAHPGSADGGDPPEPDAQRQRPVQQPDDTLEGPSAVPPAEPPSPAPTTDASSAAPAQGTQFGPPAPPGPAVPAGSWWGTGSEGWVAPGHTPSGQYDRAGWPGAPVARSPEHPTGAPTHSGPGYPAAGAPTVVLAPPLPPGAHLPAPGPYSRSGSSNRTLLIGLGLVAMLLAGVIGGVIGNALASSERTRSIGVLGEPLPGVDEAAAPPTAVEAVAERVLPSVVQLRVEAPGAVGEGSAMVLSSDGLLLTNNHVVAPAAERGVVTAVFQDGATATARIVGRDPRSDLAVIRADGVSDLVPVELGNSDSVRVGQDVVAFGAPLGLGGTVTTGIISAVDRAVNVGEESGANTATVLNALQTDAAINPGNSGGPLVDMEGRVIGINSAIATTGAQGGSIGVGFSIPVNQARRVAEELERTGKASRAILGVTVGDDPRRTGAIIRSVTPGSAAEQAGIRPGDIVLRFGDQRISNGVDLQAAVGSRAPGEVVEVQLGDRTVEATLTAAPD